jgi:flagellar hook assembly protein FlgD
MVRTLAGGGLPAGEHTVVWDGRDDSGRSLSTGVYFIRAFGAGFGETLRAVLLR